LDVFFLLLTEGWIPSVATVSAELIAARAFVISPYEWKLAYLYNPDADNGFNCSLDLPVLVVVD